MPFSQSQLLADMFLAGLYDSQAIWNKTNRNFDSRVTDKFADSVDLPINPQLVVSKSPVARDSANRKGAKKDTSKVNVPFGLYTIALSQEEEERLFYNGKLLSNVVTDGVAALDDQLDADVIAQALTTSKSGSWTGSTLSWTDVVTLDAMLSIQKAPRRDRVTLIPSQLQSQFLSIDVVKNAMAYNQRLLESGVFIINGVQFYMSPQFATADQNTIVGCYASGIATVLKGYMDRKESYDNSTRKTDIDYNTGAAVKLLRDEYAAKLTKPGL